jgi:DNA-binding CsgD family transcriptional regulator
MIATRQMLSGKTSERFVPLSTDEVPELRRTIEELVASIDWTNDIGTMPSPRRLFRDVLIDDAALRIHATVLGAAEPAHSRTILVSVERRFPELPGDGELRLRFRLTPKESTVARMLAAGRTNLEIAKELIMSPHTARHHTENVLLKMGLRSRGAVLQAMLKRHNNAIVGAD